MIRPFLLIIFLIGIYVGACAQNGDFLKRSQLVRIGETNFEYKFEKSNKSNFSYISYKMGAIETQSSSKIIKINLGGDEKYSFDSYFYSWLSSQLLAEKFVVKSLETGQVLSMDTVVYKLLGFLEENDFLDSGTCWEFPFKSYFIKQEWYYDEKKGRIFSIPVEIIPVIISRQGKKEKLFRVLLNGDRPFDSEVGLFNGRIRWAKWSVDQVSLSAFSNEEDFFRSYLLESPCFCYGSGYSSSKCPIWILGEPDSVGEEIKFEEIKGIEIKQMWFVDVQSNTIGSIVKEVSPLINRPFGIHKKYDNYPKIFTIKN